MGTPLVAAPLRSSRTRIVPRVVKVLNSVVGPVPMSRRQTMDHFDCPQVRVTHDLQGKDATPVICGPKDRGKLIGGVRADA